MITPVILSGGSGTRLWPLSRQSYPKQFVDLIGDRTLFQASALRVAADDFRAPLVVTNADFRFVVGEQLAAAGIAPGDIVIEPAARNTAPAILAAATIEAARDPEAMLLVIPSDHVIPDGAAFRAAVLRGVAAADTGDLVTFGIRPTHAETGYGYLEPASPAGTAAVKLSGFVEKPDADKAARMVAKGFLWNAGIFLFRASDMIAAFRAHAADLVPPVEAAVAAGVRDLDFFRLAPEPWAGAADISIDFAVMEKARNLSVVAYDGGWSDLGGWEAVWREGERDADGVAVSGSATAIDCRDTYLRADGERMELVGLGLRDIVAVATKDAVLVADMSRGQEVRRAVAALKAKGAPQATEASVDYRPWGWFESLAMGGRFQVKRIHVHPGAALSLQSHHHRAEHWVVVEGTARVTIDGEVQLVAENQSVYVPLGARHRLENPGKVPVVLIEVQTGTYLGEDDIVRHDDVYARGAGARG